VQFFKNGFGEPSTNIAYGLVGIASFIIAGQQEGTVDGGAFAFAVVGTEDDEIQRVTDARKVIFFNLETMLVNHPFSNRDIRNDNYLEPIPATFARLITALVTIQHFDHETFA
jgi:hypothetical protein